MLFGIGIDLCEIARMEELLKKSVFLERYFAAEEQAYIKNRGKLAASSMAAMYAAKEAFAKALGTGINGFDLREVCVRHWENGAPYYQLSGRAEELVKQLGISSLFLSITHEAGMAAAVCAAERTL